MSSLLNRHRVNNRRGSGKAKSLRPNTQRGIAMLAALLVIAALAGLGLCIGKNATPSTALERAVAHGDPAWAVSLKLDQEQVPTGRDDAAMSVINARAGYLLLIQAGTDGKSLELIFPNELDHDNVIGLGETRLPRPQWRLKASGPAGTARCLPSCCPARPTSPQCAPPCPAIDCPTLAPATARRWPAIPKRRNR